MFVLLNLERICRILRPSILDRQAACLVDFVDFLGLRTQTHRILFPNLNDWSFSEAFPFTNATNLTEQFIPLVYRQFRRYFPTKLFTKSCHFKHKFRFVGAEHTLILLHWSRHSYRYGVSATSGKT